MGDAGFKQRGFGKGFVHMHGVVIAGNLGKQGNVILCDGFGKFGGHADGQVFEVVSVLRCHDGFSYRLFCTMPKKDEHPLNGKGGHGKVSLGNVG